MPVQLHRAHAAIRRSNGAVCGSCRATAFTRNAESLEHRAFHIDNRGCQVGGLYIDIAVIPDAAQEGRDQCSGQASDKREAEGCLAGASHASPMRRFCRRLCYISDPPVRGVHTGQMD